MGGVAMWDYRRPERAFDDVLLPLHLEDLRKSRPKRTDSRGYRASWLLRKAAIFERLSGSDEALKDEAWQIAKDARRTALRLQREMTRDLLPELLIDEEVFEDGSPTVLTVGFTSVR